jgi:hypothetical protein
MNISNKSSESIKAPAANAQLRDRTGWPIPPTIAERWQQAENTTDAALRDVGRWRDQFDKLRRQPGKRFGRANVSKLHALLHDSYIEISLAMPYAVCPDCQGMLMDSCKLCVGYGYVSQSIWDNVVTLEDKRMRAAVLKGRP